MTWRLHLLFFVATSISSCTSSHQTTTSFQSTFDFEAHRGGRGLMPENTIAAMMNAVDLGVTTLEMDVVISGDNKVVVSHDPFFAETITTTPDGKYLNKKQAEEYLLYKMNYNDIRKFDVGIKPHPTFAKQKKIPAYKPLLAVLIDSVEAYAKGKGRTMQYNIEIKSREGFDGIRHPDPSAFSEILITVLKEKNILNRTIIQSFDVRPLQYIHQKYPSIQLSYLVEKVTVSLQKQLDKLTFTPQVYSPNFAMVTKAMVAKCHAKGMKVIPWTVNTLKEMNELVAMGVDGIISDYPDIFADLQVTK